MQRLDRCLPDATKPRFRTSARPPATTIQDPEKRSARTAGHKGGRWADSRFSTRVSLRSQVGILFGAGSCRFVVNRQHLRPHVPAGTRPMDRFEEAKLRVKEANDLVAWIESYLPLKPRGHRLLVALCPFHKESTPSFTVYADSQHYHCFGCGKSGDVFTFLMEREGLSFREAM